MTNGRLSGRLVWLWMSLIAAGAMAATESTESLHQAIEAVYPALVRLDVVQVRSYEGRMQKRRVFGSGVIISNTGHVITNHHVAGGASHIVCRLVDGRQCRATLVGTDALSDIAVVQLQLSDLALDQMSVVAQFGDSDTLRVGDTVFAMGSPAALSQSVTQGIVSNTAMILPQAFERNRSMDVDGEMVGSLVRWIGHDAVLFGGNSGGPLVDAEGRIIGINEMGVGSLGGAIPGNLAKSVADQILSSGVVSRSWIGAVGQPRLAQSGQSQGILVGSVYEDSPAQQADVRPGDLILSYDGIAIDCALNEDLPIFNGLVLGTPIGKAVTLVLARDSQTLTCEVTTQARGRKRSPSQELKEWGMAVRDMTFLSALDRGFPGAQGILIDSVASGGPGGLAKPPLQRNDILQDINGQSVTDVNALRTLTTFILRDKTPPIPVVATVNRKGQLLFCVAEIGLPRDRRPARFASKAWLPVETQVLTRELVKALELPIQGGVRVTRVFTGHAAAQAGLQVGDILLALDGLPIEASDVQDIDVLPTMVRQYRIGTEAALTVLREGSKHTVRVVLEARLPLVAEQPRYSDTAFEFTLRDLAFTDRLDLQLDNDVAGVLVESVQAAGWAALADLRPHDVVVAINGSPVPMVSVARDVLLQMAMQKKARVVFFVQRGRKTQFIEVETTWE
ncbi:PDZ domain-containing protein [Planctomycetota bacterium]